MGERDLRNELRELTFEIKRKKELLRHLEEKRRLTHDVIHHGENVSTFVRYNQNLVLDIKRRQQQIKEDLAAIAQEKHNNERLQRDIEKEHKDLDAKRQGFIDERVAMEAQRRDLRKLINQADQAQKALTANQRVLAQLRTREGAAKNNLEKISAEQRLLDATKQEVLRLQQGFAKQNAQQDHDLNVIEQKRLEIDTYAKEKTAQQRKTYEQQRADIEQRKRQLDEYVKENKHLILEAEDARKEREKIQRSIDEFKRLQADAAKRETALRGKENELKELSKELAGSAKEYERNQQLLTTVREEQSLLEKKHAELRQLVQEGEAAKRTLAETKQKLDLIDVSKKQLRLERARFLEEIHQKTAALTQKEKAYAALAAETKNMQREAEKNRRDLEHIQEQRKQLQEELAHADAIRKLVAVQDQQMTTIQKGEQSLEKENEQLTKEKTALAKRSQEVARREKEIITSERATINHREALVQVTEELASERNKLVALHDTVRSRIATFSEEFSRQKTFIEAAGHETKDLLTSTRTLLESDLRLLQQKEQELRRAVEDNKTWEERLQHEEESLVAAVRTMEKEKKIVSSKTSFYTGRQQELTKQETDLHALRTSLERQRTSLREQQQKVEQAKELLKGIPQLEKKHERLLRLVKKAKQELFVERVDPLVKEQILKEKERDVKELEDKLEKKMRALVSKDHSTDTSLHRPLTKNRSIHEQIEYVRQLLNEGKSKEALLHLAELEVFLSKVKKSDEKNILAYEVKILRNNIKLAELA